MDLIELPKTYYISKKYLLLNLTNVLKSTTKNVKKGKKKSAPIFFILKHIIKDFKTSKFYYLKVLA
jgi:hypothetical protein